jgi:GABA(A) receptor-associated protein
MEFINEFKNSEWTKRLAKSQMLRQKYPTRIPIIVDRQNNKTPMIVENKKFAFPLEMQEIIDGVTVTRVTTVSHFQHTLRKYIPGLRPDQSIFLFIAGQNVIPHQTQTMSQLYEEYREKCGFLYITYSFESTFGNSTKILDSEM